MANVRMFDVFESPNFELDHADRAAAQVLALRAGLGVLSALVGVGVWKYFWSEKSESSITPLPLRSSSLSRPLCICYVPIPERALQCWLSHRC